MGASREHLNRGFVSAPSFLSLFPLGAVLKGRGLWEMLGRTLFKSGREALATSSGEEKACREFALAIEFSSIRRPLLFAEGSFLLRQGRRRASKPLLMLARQCFREIVRRRFCHFRAWYWWGKVLYALGMLTGERSFLLNARSKYEKAEELIGVAPKKSKRVVAEFFWDYGRIWFQLALGSGEAVDAQHSVDQYRAAYRCYSSLPMKFWIDFSDSCRQLGEKTNRLELMWEGVECCRRAVFLSNNFAKRAYLPWYKMAGLFRELHQVTHDEEYEGCASFAFSASARLYKKDPRVWYEWAQLLLERGDRLKEKAELCAAIDKCRMALRYSFPCAKAIPIWASSLASIGLLSDQVHLIHEAREKLEMVEQRGDEYFYASGRCLAAFGHYFQDSDFYYRAVEQFQKGVGLNRFHDRLWHALGVIHLSLAEEEQDEQPFRRAIKFFERAFSLKRTYLYRYCCAFSRFKFGEMFRYKSHLQRSVHEFERMFGEGQLSVCKYAEWWFYYACALDNLGELIGCGKCYRKALGILEYLSMVDPDLDNLYHRLGLACTRYAGHTEDVEIFERAFRYYRLAHKRDEDNSQVLLDWGIALLHSSECAKDEGTVKRYFTEAEHRMLQAVRLGSVCAYYFLGCLYAMVRNSEQAMFYLQKAQRFNSLPSMEELLTDEWLSNLRHTDMFQAFLQKIAKSYSHLDL